MASSFISLRNDAGLPLVGPAGLPCTERRTVWRGKKGCLARRTLVCTQGFIHCSKPSQIVEVAKLSIAASWGLVLLVIDPANWQLAEVGNHPPEPAPAHARVVFATYSRNQTAAAQPGRASGASLCRPCRFRTVGIRTKYLRGFS
jgi:hypothetical protein